MNVDEFIRQRSIAFSSHFDRFIADRGLEWDTESWSEQDLNDFNEESKTLIAEWNARANEVEDVE